MLKALQLYYLCTCAVLFAYAVYRPRNAIRVLPLGMALNIFPLAATHYMNMDVARLASMPLVYLPVTAIGLALILRNGARVPQRYRSVVIWMGIFLVYTFCNTVLARGISPANMIYWLAWPLNFLMFLATASVVARLEPAFLDRVLNHCVILLVAGSVLGLARYASGYEPDANFIPLMNRNGTVVVIALLFPLVFHVHHTQRKSRAWLIGCAGTIALCVVLTFSRSGLVGLMLGMVLYYGHFSLKGLLKFGAAVTVVAAFLASGIAQETTDRLINTGNTITAMLEGRQIDRNTGDHNRVRLVNGAIATAKQHFWFGTGLGMENYRQGLQKASLLPLTSKSHNFYLSYFAELGLAGFALLMIVLQRLYTCLAPLGSPLRAFRVTFLVMAVMMAMNEYILLPELWVVFGMLSGISHIWLSAAAAHRAYTGPAGGAQQQMATRRYRPLSPVHLRGTHG